jgi:hypothetical protein
MSQALFPKYRVLWMDPAERPDFTPPGVAHCCADMTAALEMRCDRHDDPFECADSLVSYSAVFDEYGLIVHDGGASSVLIAYCPWCGAKLPESRRDRWYDELEALGFEDPLGEEIPEPYRSAAWRLAKGA